MTLAPRDFTSEAVNLAADWADISTGLRKDLGHQLHSQWIKPIQVGALEKDTGVLHLFLPTEFSANWVKDRFEDRLQLAWTIARPEVRQVKIQVHPGRRQLPELRLDDGRRPANAGASAIAVAAGTIGAAGWLIRPLRAASVIERVGLAIAGGTPGDSETSESGSGHVLIADDNPINGLIARRALESSGFVVTVAGTGREALDVVEQISPDLILMDLRMPIMDGFEATRHMRAQGRKTPVIAVSAEINPEIEKRARLAGADGVAAKPLEAEALRQLALKWVGLTSNAGAA